MPSYSRNSRKPTQVLRLAIAGVVQGGALLAGSVTHAADQSDKFVMTAYTDVAGGAHLVSGDFQTALAQTKLSKASDDTLETNKCVAYTMTWELPAAKSQCDAAISSVKHEMLQVGPATLWKISQLKEYLAVAYSNRAVLEWLSHDAAAAGHDLDKAVALSPQADFVTRNISALHSPQHENENALAQVTPTPQR